MIRVFFGVLLCLASAGHAESSGAGGGGAGGGGAGGGGGGDGGAAYKKNPLAEKHLLPDGAGARPLKQDAVPEIKFPCEDAIKKAGDDRPKINLVGEVHYSRDAEHARALVELDACAGKCCATLEGRFCVDDASPFVPHSKKMREDDAKKNLHGFDDPMTHAFSGLLVCYDELKQKIDRPGAMKVRETLVNSFANTELLKRAWKMTRKEKPFTGDDGEEEIAQVFDAILETKTSAELNAIMKKLKPQESAFFTDDHAFLSVIKRWIRGYTKMVNALEAKEKTLYAVPTNLTEHVEDFLRGRNIESGLDAITLHWRNQFMAQRIAAQYCKALTAKPSLPLFVITGLYHVPGLKKLLEDALAKLKVSGVVVAKESKDLLPVPKFDPFGSGIPKIPDFHLPPLDEIPLPPVPDLTVDKPMKIYHQYDYDKSEVDSTKPEIVEWTKDGVRYTVRLRDVVSFDKKTVLEAKGAIHVLGRGGVMNTEGRKKYALSQLEAEVKKNPDSDVAKAIRAAELPASTTIKADEQKGPDTRPALPPRPRAASPTLGKPVDSGPSAGGGDEDAKSREKRP